ncbi:TetR/AcrR family transcriptional regulator [Clostridium beijerinckii]|uniref:TetR/AcrR family transcriptional regulator n=1 Tax=Clostridium beijerinckii TaxID=1520 RepID=UPI00047A2745|nr:TetR/AcrR family transcriptional regulator [Clostridium beijerinckii]
MNNNVINENLDLRVRRMHKLLFDALISLLTEKNFNDIRISDICDKAMIHRTTFYKHFEDKFQLLDFMLRQLIQDFEKKSLQYTPMDTPKEYYANLFRLLLEHMCENKKMYSIGLLNNGSAMKQLQKIVLECIKSKLINDQNNGIKFIIPIDVIADFYSPALVYSAGEWLEEGMLIPIDEMVDYCKIIADALQVTHKN